MANSLAIAFISSNKNANFAEPNDTVTFKFSSPPTTASSVLIKVLETVEFLDPARKKITDQPIGGFRGSIVNGQFQVEKLLGAPLPPEPDPVLIRVATSLNAGAPHVFAHMPEPEQIQSHTLRLSVEGVVNGVKETVDATNVLHMEYPLAMIVPTPPTPSADPSMAVVESWSQQWKQHKPTFRHVEHVPTVKFNRTAKASDYDPLVAAFVACAKKATSGVVALAVGHGDGGESRGTTIAWCNLMPENFPVPDATPANPNPKFLYHLDIDENNLSFGTVPSNLLGNGDFVKLDVLDRLADALTSSGIRRIILHTCSAGKNAAFMQTFADRVQVPLLAHTRKIEYTGVAGSGNILAGYKGLATVSPRDLRNWPIVNLSSVFRPGVRPKLARDFKRTGP